MTALGTVLLETAIRTVSSTPPTATSMDIHVTQPDTGCKYIVRSPAGVTIYEGCGIPVVAVTGPVCQKVTLESTFMLQFCEAVDHAAITRSKKRSEEAVEE